MASITHPGQPDSLRHLDYTAALAVVQSLHRHLEPHALVQVLWSHAATLTRATGLRYLHTGHGLELAFGDGCHTARYTLNQDGEDLGELTLSFQRQADEQALGTVEDLLALAMPAVHNALAYYALRTRAERLEAAQAVSPPRLAARSVERAPGEASESGSDWDDALVLVSLDGFEDIRTAHGEVWAQTLVQTIQSQIHEGLRDADSAFQIDEGVLAVLLPRTSEDAAIDVAGKIRVLISGLHLRDGRITRQLTACMGVVGARNAARPEDVLDQARAALSQARDEGSGTIRAYREHP